MASYTLKNTPFPNGTSVGAYSARGYVSFPGGGPPGSAVATATVTAGKLEFTGLTDHTPYFAAAEVGGKWKSWRFIPGEDGPPPDFTDDIDSADLEPGRVLVVNEAEDGYEFVDLSLANLNESVNTVEASGATETLTDPDTVHYLTLTANCTITFPTAAVGKAFALVLKQDGTGSRTVTWPGTVKWPGGTVPVLTTTKEKTDVLSFLSVDGTNWIGFLAAQNV